VEMVLEGCSDYEETADEERNAEVTCPESGLGFVDTAVLPDTAFHDPVVEVMPDKFTNEDGDDWCGIKSRNDGGAIAITEGQG